MDRILKYSPSHEVPATILMHPTPSRPVLCELRKLPAILIVQFLRWEILHFVALFGSGVVIYMCALQTRALVSLTTVIAIKCFCYFLSIQWTA
jgi:hypothetical protein